MENLSSLLGQMILMNNLAIKKRIATLERLEEISSDQLNEPAAKNPWEYFDHEVTNSTEPLPVEDIESYSDPNEMLSGDPIDIEILEKTTIHGNSREIKIRESNEMIEKSHGNAEQKSNVDPNEMSNVDPNGIFYVKSTKLVEDIESCNESNEMPTLRSSDDPIEMPCGNPSEINAEHIHMSRCDLNKKRNQNEMSTGDLSKIHDSKMSCFYSNAEQMSSGDSNEMVPNKMSRGDPIEMPRDDPNEMSTGDPNLTLFPNKMSRGDPIEMPRDDPTKMSRGDLNKMTREMSYSNAEKVSYCDSNEISSGNLNGVSCGNPNVMACSNPSETSCGDSRSEMSYRNTERMSFSNQSFTEQLCNLNKMSYGDPNEISTDVLFLNFRLINWKRLRKYCGMFSY